MKNDPLIEVKNVTCNIGGQTIHNKLNLTVYEGEILGIVGGSGSGKTTLLREILGLTKPQTGSIKVFGENILDVSTEKMLNIQKRWGVLFQQNALFSSLNVLENISFPLRERTNLEIDIIHQLAILKLELVGLDPNTARKYPAELSGGMEKRAALARALVLDPELVFLDEPSTGLDPDSAAGLDELILNLHRTMGLTIVMVTHDLDTLWRITDRVAFLGEGKVLCVDKIENLVNNPHPAIQDFFRGPRGRTVERIYKTNGN